jgi:hypothetical protein
MGELEAEAIRLRDAGASSREVAAALTSLARPLTRNAICGIWHRYGKPESPGPKNERKHSPEVIDAVVSRRLQGTNFRAIADFVTATIKPMTERQARSCWESHRRRSSPWKKPVSPPPQEVKALEKKTVEPGRTLAPIVRVPLPVKSARPRLDPVTAAEAVREESFMEGYMGQTGRVTFVEWHAGLCLFEVKQHDGEKKYCGDKSEPGTRWCPHHAARVFNNPRSPA